MSFLKFNRVEQLTLSQDVLIFFSHTRINWPVYVLLKVNGIFAAKERKYHILLDAFITHGITVMLSSGFLPWEHLMARCF